MRTNITTILVMALVILANSVLDVNHAEARSTCICATPNGTLYHGCPVHGNQCLAVGPHEHENTRGRRADLPTFCSVNGQNFLVYEPTCDNVRKEVREYERAVRAQERAERRRSNNTSLTNNYITQQAERRAKRNVNRIRNDVRSNIRNSINDVVDGFFGLR